MSDALIHGTFWIALLFSVFAGMTTSVGALVAVLPRATNHRFTGMAVGFSAGALLLLALGQALPGSYQSLAQDQGTDRALALVIGSMVLAVIGLLCVLRVASMVSVDRLGTSRLAGPSSVDRATLARIGSAITLALVLHNFTDGFMTFATMLESPRTGILVAAAIAISNIPEGMAVAAPVYSATGDRWRAFRWGSLSGLAEPVGAVIGFALLSSVLTPTVTSMVIAGIAGIMMYISLGQLVPLTGKYGSRRVGLISLMAGSATALLGLSLVGV